MIKEYGEQIEYWMEQLSGDMPVLDLPHARRPGVPTLRMARHPLTIPKTLTGKIKSLSSNEETSLFITLLTAFKTLLFRYLGQEDIAVGSSDVPVLRSDLSGNPSFRELIHRVKDVVHKAYAHLDLPFAVLLKELRPDRGNKPWCQAAFTMGDKTDSKKEANSLKWDLCLNLKEKGEQITGFIQYNAGLFDPAGITRIGGHFLIMLAGIAADPDLSIAALPVLTHEERRLLLEEWSSEGTDYPLDKCLHALFSRQAARTPDAVALVFEDGCLTFSELEQRSSLLARYLLTLRVTPGLLLGICVERSIEMIVGLLGILKAGAAYLPLNPASPPERLSLLLHDAQVNIILTQEALAEKIPGKGLQLICLDSGRQNNSREGEDFNLPHITAENLAYLIYTSGSTGRPKGVAVSHGNLCPLLHWGYRHLDFKTSDRAIQYLSYFFDWSAWEIFLTLTSGAALFMISTAVLLDSRKTLDFITKNSISILHATPTQFQFIISAGPGLETLKYACIGAEKMTYDLVERCLEILDCGCRIFNMYGPTEAAIITTILEIDRTDPGKYSGLPSVPIGPPVANARCYILDNNRNPQPIGVPGGLYIGGDGLARGYLNRPELTAENFIPVGRGRDRGTYFLYRSGDLARWLADRTIEFIGRLDLQVKIRGVRVELEEIEAVLSQHPAVSQAVVIVREDEPGFKRLVGYVVCPGESPTTGELFSFIREKLPRYMLPSAILLLDKLPLAPGGKLDRRALPAPGTVRPGLRQTHTAPRTPVERLLADIMSNLLGVEGPGIRDDFFEYGAHSLMAARAISRIAEAFQVRIPLASFFENPDIESLAAVIESARSAGKKLQVPPIKPVSREQYLPLSFGQERLWFIDRLDPGNPTYNISFTYRFEGDLNRAAVEQSINEIIRRHEALRTTFASSKKGPSQIIAAELKLEIPLVDLSCVSGKERSTEVQKLTLGEARLPFVLAKGPLLRIILLKVTDKEHRMVTTMHHTVYDGWSVDVFNRELVLLYEAFAAGLPGPMPQPRLKYADFAYWQRHTLPGEILDRQMDFWVDELAGSPAFLELPTDRPRPAVRSSRGDRFFFSFPAPLLHDLKEINCRENTTLFMILLAAFNTLLFRYSGHEDVPIGSPISNRSQAELEDLIGFFVDTIVLRSNLSGNPTFQQLLKRVRTTTLRAFSHKELPFELLVKKLQPQRNLGYNPLFQVAFVVQETFADRLEIEGLTIFPEEVANKTAKFDLTLSLEERNGELTGFIEYAADLFDMATIVRMAGHLQVMLTGIAANPDCAIAALPLLTEAECSRLLEEWCSEGEYYPVDKCLHTLFAEQVDRTPGNVAAVFAGECLTFAELDRRAGRLANYLLTLGVGPGILVGICVERSMEMLVGLLGILKARGAYLPLDPGLPAERLRFMLEDTGVEIVLIQDALAEKFPGEGIKVISLNSGWQVIETEKEKVIPPELTTANLAYMIYTSGSTGKPKGVAVTHSNLCPLLHWGYRHLGFRAADRAIQYLSYFFDWSTWEIFLTLTSGAALFLISNEILLDAQETLRFIGKNNITILHATPTQFQFIASSGGKLESLRYACIGAEKMSIELIEHCLDILHPQCRIFNMYGPTEAAIITTVLEIDRTDPAKYRGLTSIPIGPPVSNAHCFILDSNKNPLPVGVPGELYIGGDGVASGYLNRPELTQGSFISLGRLGRRNPGLLYRSGDLVRWLPDGTIEFSGRIDSQVKVRGFRIELGEIEVVLEQHEAVLQAVVVVREDQPAGKQLVGYVVGNEQPTTTVELLEYLKEKLPQYMVPSALVILDKLPLTPGGKLDYRALPAAEAASPDLEEPYAAPRTPVEEKVVKIWAEVLELERVGTRDNFFQCGGHSMIATRVMNRLRQTFQVELSIRSLFEWPTVEELSRVITRALQTKETKGMKKIPRREDLRSFPLSFAQQRLWFLDQFEPDNPFYNVYEAFRLSGPFNKEAFEKTLQEILRRHEVLRSTYKTVQGKAFQGIAPVGDVLLPLADISTLTTGEQEVEVKHLSREEARRPFDLGQGALVRTTLLKLGEEEHVLLLTMHHIVSDAWSLEVFFKECAVLYKNFADVKPSSLPELPIQYADYAEWQNRWFAGETYGEQLSYWREKLGNNLPVLQLPTDRPRPPLQTYRGAIEKLILPRTLAAALRALSSSEGNTLFITMLAAFKTILYRYTGSEDVVVGSPIANRSRSETEGLIGFFLNTLVLRTDLSGNPTFLELLGRVRQVTLDAYSHQDLPFEKLVEELHPERDLSRTPLFQVMFSHQTNPLEELEIGDIKITPLDIHGGTAKFDIELAVIETKEELTCLLEYNTDLFDRSTVLRFLGHYHTLLNGITAVPQQHIANLPLLTESEQRQLLVEWNRTGREYPGEACLHRLFEAQVERTPAARSINFVDLSLTYGECNRQANRLTHQLVARGVKAETPVGVCMERSLEMVIALFGILKAGGAYVPLDPSYPKERLVFMMADAAVPVFITQRHLEAVLPAHEAETIFFDSREDLACREEENPGRGVEADNLAYIIYTSGSTGQPKGSMITHSGIRNRLLWMQEAYHLTARDVVVQKTPFSFDVSVWEFFWPQICGASLVVARPEGHKDSTYLVELITQKGITVIHFVPPMLKVFLDEERVDACTSLRLVVCSGEALPFELQERFFSHLDAALHNLYGPTEASVDVTAWACQAGSSLDFVPIGKPIANISIFILDSFLQPVPIGIAGGLHIGGVGLARAYLNRPDLTAEKFIMSRTRLYRTGDLVSFLSDGNIKFLNRLDDQVKIRGFRVELGEIETALAQHPGLRQTLVLAREDVPGDKRLTAYFVPEGENSPSVDNLRTFLKDKLPEYMVPAFFIKLAEMPLTPNGKVDRRALPPPDSVRPELTEAYTAPQSRDEKILAGIWCDVLGLERVGVHDRFFHLGGDSIRSIQVRSKAREKGIDFTLQQLFKHQTIRELLTSIKNKTAGPAASIKKTPFSLVDREDRLRLPRNLEDAYPLVKLQSGMLYHSEYSSDSTAYHDIASFRLQASFDLDALHRSLERVIIRHQVLRTSFDLENFSRMLQLVHKTAFARVEVENWRRLSPQEQEEAFHHWIDKEKNHHYDLGSPPLLRFQVHRLTNRIFRLTMSFHHVILDGWSASSLITEILKHYHCFLAGENPVAAPPPKVTYRDFVALEQAALASREIKDFWDEKLRGCTITPIPGWPAAIKRRGSTGNQYVRVPVPAPVSEGLKQLARSIGVSLKSVLLAGHIKVMRMVTGQEAVITGLVMNGRPEEEGGEEVLGLFLNSLPFPVKPGPGSWIDLVKETFALEGELLAYRRYPLAQLQKEHGGQPLFDTAFNFNHFHVYKDIEGLDSLKVMDVFGFEQTNFPLIVNFIMDGFTSQLYLELNFDTGKLCRKQVELMGTYYSSVLDAMVGNPQAGYDSVSLIPEEERRRLLVEWNDTDRDYPEGQTIQQLFEEQVERTPHTAALLSGERQLTYLEISRRANHFSHLLIERGVIPGMLVGICAERCVELVIGILSILKAGGAYMPFDPGYPRKRLEFLVKDTNIKILLIEKKFSGTFPAGSFERISLDSAVLRGRREQTTNPLVNSGPDNLAYINYTSGSTGTPKGVAVPHRGVTRLLFGVDYFPWRTPQIILHLSPIYFDASTFELWGALLHGGRSVLFPPGIPTAAKLGEILRKYAVTTTWLTSSLFNTVIDEDPQLLASLERVLTGGETLSVHHIRRALKALPGIRITNGYGPTESTTFTCCYPIPAALAEDIPSISIGRPIGNTRVYILDKNFYPAPTGVPGELFIAGAGLARGYLNRPEPTVENFIRLGGERIAETGLLYRTGDLVRWLPDGRIEFIGRLDLQVKIHGFRVEPGEIEVILGSHPAVRRTAVMAREDTPGERRLVAYVVTGGETEPTVTDLRSYLQDKLPKYMVPSLFIFLESLPLGPTGKVDYPSLPAPDSLRPELDTVFTAPRNKLEEDLEKIWSEVLGIDQVGIHDDFFELGGDSILTIQVTAKAARIGLSVTPARLIETPTIAELAEKESPSRAIHAEQGEVRGRVDLTPIQCWFFEQNLPESHHWNQSLLLELKERVDASLMEEVLQRLIVQHDALRLRFRKRGNSWHQEHGKAADSLVFSHFDLSNLPQADQDHVRGSSSAELQASLDLADGPLVRAALFDPGEKKAQHLLLVIHHLVVDGVSWRILLEDIQDAYRQLCRGKGVKFPAKTTSYKYWARRLRDYAESKELHQEISLWSTARSGKIFYLSRDFPDGINSEASAETFSLSLSEGETRLILQKVPQAFQVQVNHILLTALLQSFLSQTGQNSLVLDLEGHGREELFPDVDLSGTVGWFTAIFPVLLRLDESAAPQEVLKSTRQQLQGIPDHGVGYGILRYISRDPEIKETMQRLPQPEISFNYLGQFDQVVSGSSLFRLVKDSPGPDHSPQGNRRYLIDVIVYILEGQLHTDWVYSKNIHTSLRIENLALRFKDALRSFIFSSLSYKIDETAALETPGMGYRRRRTAHSSLVCLQPRGSNPPFFCVHAAGGNVLSYVDLAKLMNSDRPFYGLQSIGMEEGQEPLSRIEDMASVYIEAIRSLQSRGPYFLGGWCMGGTLAFEMAQQLIYQGEKVAFLALIDSMVPLPGQDESEEDNAELLAGLFAGVLPLSLEELRKLRPDQQLEYVLKKAKRKSIMPIEEGIPRLRRLLQVYKLNVNAWLGYEFRPYPGRLTFFRAIEQEPGMPSTEKPWKGLALQGIDVCDSPGHHADMVNIPHVHTLAQKLREALDRAAASL